MGKSFKKKKKKKSRWTQNIKIWGPRVHLSKKEKKKNSFNIWVGVLIFPVYGHGECDLCNPQNVHHIAF